MADSLISWVSENSHFLLCGTGLALIVAGIWPGWLEKAGGRSRKQTADPIPPGLEPIPQTTASPTSTRWAFITLDTPARAAGKTPATSFREVRETLEAMERPPERAEYLGLGTMVLDGRIADSLWPSGENIYVIGDLHGDFFALAYLTEQIWQMEKKLNLLFLGDLVDRGPHSAECLVLLDHLARKGKVLWLAGNHDLSLGWSQESGRFHSMVDPAEYCDGLNQPTGSEIRRLWARHLVALAPSLPRAFLHSSGLLFTHGGFPLADLQARRPENPELLHRWLEQDGCLNDFTWTRLTRHARKIPNRETLGASYGHEDFEDFCTAVAPWADIRALVAGHQHSPEGFDVHPSWKNRPALTLTGFGFSEHTPFGKDYRPYLTALRMRSGHNPELLRIAIDPNLFSNFMKQSTPLSRA